MFRVVLANPLTSKTILQDVLAEQTLLAQESETFLAYSYYQWLKELIGFSHSRYSWADKRKANNISY